MEEIKEMGRYTIKDVANFAGMSTEAVRYYEKQGLISAEKNEENGYRYYKTWDIHMLMQARLYRQYGYSMNETKEMLQSKSVDALEEIFEKKKQELHDNIVLQMRMLNYIKDRCSILHSTRQLNQNVCLEIRPEMYRFDIQNNYRLINDNSDVVNRDCLDNVDKEMYDKLYFGCLKYGVRLMPEKGRTYITTAHTKEDIDRTLEVFEMVFKSF